MSSIAIDIDLSDNVKQDIFLSKIIDPDTSMMAKNDYNEFAFFGGFGSGKSYIVMVSVFLLCVTYPKMHAAFIRGTYDELKDSVIPQFLKLFQHLNVFIYKIQDRQLIFENGTRLDFRAFDVDTKILSNEYDFVAFSQLEEIDKALFLQVLGRNRGGNIPKNIILAEGNPSDNWVYVRYKLELPKNVFFIQSSTYDNKYLLKRNPNYVQILKDNYPDAWFRRYVLGEWENYDERVLTEFRADIHIIPALEVNEIERICNDGLIKKVIGMDYGFKNPSAMLWSYINYNGDVIVFDEFYGAECLPVDLARENMRWGRLLTVIDPSTKQGDRDGISVFDELVSRYKLNLLEASKSKARNIMATNMLLKKKKLFFTENCINAIREARSVKYKRIKIGAETVTADEVVKKDDHAFDCLMYLVAHIEFQKSKTEEENNFKNTIMYHASMPNRLLNKTLQS